MPAGNGLKIPMDIAYEAKCSGATATSSWEGSIYLGRKSCTGTAAMTGKRCPCPLSCVSADVLVCFMGLTQLYLYWVAGAGSSNKHCAKGNVFGKDVAVQVDCTNGISTPKSTPKPTSKPTSKPHVTPKPTHHTTAKPTVHKPTAKPTHKPKPTAVKPTAKPTLHHTKKATPKPTKKHTDAPKHKPATTDKPAPKAPTTHGHGVVVAKTKEGHPLYQVPPP